MRAIRLFSLSAAAIACGVAITAPAVAATRTAQFNVTAQVQPNCNITATDMNFGTYSASAAVDATSAITVTCTLLLPFSVGLNDGQNGGGSVTARKMRGTILTSNFLNYELHTNALYSLTWGLLPENSVIGVGTGLPQTLTIYGRIPAGSSAPAGSYSDTVTATITY